MFRRWKKEKIVIQSTDCIHSIDSKKNHFYRKKVHGTVIVGKPKPNQVFSLTCKEVDKANCREFKGGKLIGKKKSIKGHKSI